MPATQTAYEWLRARVAPPAVLPPPAPRRERDARAELDRLRGFIAELVDDPAGSDPRAALEDALAASAQLQVVTANIDACNAPKPAALGKTLVGFADGHLYGRADAIERGMTYTADNTLRILQQ